ncbi:hypothetical protein [Roseibacillus persicicus]|uniref:UbiD family decarboxylase n=1 Tax=Roseibacillus persicicus TaxID=454148 RepID=A0A918WHH0_9BACT|nr:hypothetical protein [Roseibacillus persicicus]GHC44433.1 hypothetical protein GCM10007100_07160 [Roseibacillus persicicus]
MEEDVWRFLAWHLQKAGIETVLVGGAVVAIYTEGLYQSGDLDMVPDEFERKRIEEVLTAIGFEARAGRYFGHPQCEHLLVEFPKGPVELGEEFPVTPAEELVSGEILKILSPTDCVKDRLAGYIHWQTRDTFDQAVLVCKKQAERIDWSVLKNWCKREGALGAYEELEKAVQRE